MQTFFTAEQLKTPCNAVVNEVARSCVHCGFCTATCPSYLVLGNELDSPRGRIALVKDMLEQNQPATADITQHIDTCLSCLSCMSTCPSGVNYMHLIDEARAYIEETYQRPFFDRHLRSMLAVVLTNPRLFRLSLLLARPFRPLAPLLAKFGLKRLGALLGKTPQLLPRPAIPQQQATTKTLPKGRIGLVTGCIQDVLSPSINAATIELLTRLGYEVVLSPTGLCCGSLPLHLGKIAPAKFKAEKMLEFWAEAQVEAIVMTTSGCGTTVKDYGHIFREDAKLADIAQTVAAKVYDISEFLVQQDLPNQPQTGIRVTYQAACSLQHGQNIKEAPIILLQKAGYEVATVAESHICCGSAGTYNILQPVVADALRVRKRAHIADTAPQVIASGNIGCIMQLTEQGSPPVVHTVELLNWGYGGVKPAALLVGSI